jgi:hypothetical protein
MLLDRQSGLLFWTGFEAKRMLINPSRFWSSPTVFESSLNALKGLSVKGFKYLLRSDIYSKKHYKW